MNTGTLENISNRGYSQANRTSFYNKQKQSFEKNIQNYDRIKEAPVHQHVRDIKEMFCSLTQHPACKYHNVR